MAGPIAFYFEFASPYAYLAAQRIDEAAARCGRGVDWRAISLAHVLKARGVSRDAMPREKLDYILRDALRAAEMAAVPMRLPESFPVDSKAARQAFWRLKARDPALAVRFARAAAPVAVVRGADIATAEQLAEAAAPLGVPAEEIAAAQADATARQAAIDATDRAVAEGVFGAPSFIVDGELFWGQDRIAMVEWRLSQARPA
jgi:2-hydroxychromene-2-carboxylate isomerase